MKNNKETKLEWWQVAFTQYDFEDTQWALDYEHEINLEDVDLEYFNLSERR